MEVASGFLLIKYYIFNLNHDDIKILVKKEDKIELFEAQTLLENPMWIILPSHRLFGEV